MKKSKTNTTRSSTQTMLSRRELLRLMGITAATTSLPLLSGCAIDPVTGNKTLVGMSKTEEIRLDHLQAPRQFSNDYGVVQDDNLNSYINKLGHELAIRSHRPDMPFTFRAVNAAYINAYSLPGGSIAVTRGMLINLENESQLAALLGHEIGHVTARHAAEQSIKGTLAGVLLTGASIATSVAGYGNAAGLIQNLGGVGAGAFLASYSRDNERESDALGMEYMTRAGYTPEGMVELTDVLIRTSHRKPGAVDLMFATHPMSSERHATARHLADTQYATMLNGGAVNRQRFMDNTAGLRRIKNAITDIQKAETALREKKFTEAEEHLQKALTIAPNDYTALVIMAKSRIMQKKHTDAERYATKATRVYPTEAQAHIIAGISSIEIKKFDQALHQLQEYDRLLPGNVQILFLQGKAQEGLQKREEAAQSYYKYIQKVKKGPDAQYAYNRLTTWGYLKRNR